MGDDLPFELWVDRGDGPELVCSAASIKALDLMSYLAYPLEVRLDGELVAWRIPGDDGSDPHVGRPFPPHT
jgi:hypothetical protein